MSYDADWQNKATIPILRFLDETDFAFSNSGLVYNLQRWNRWNELQDPPSEATINRALKGLREQGLVDRPRGNLYVINDQGRAFLTDENS